MLQITPVDQSALVSSFTDLVIAVSVFEGLDIDKLWITFGKGKDLLWIPIHDLVTSLGPRAKALPFFHAFTGCDTVLAFVGKGKKSAWQVFSVCDRATEVFQALSKPCDTVTETDISVIKEFVAIIYDRSTSTTRVNEASLEHFARKQYNSIPHQCALIEHVKRATLQIGHT